MRTRPLVAATVAAAALAVTPLTTGTAQAADLENINKTAFDSTPTVTASAVHIGNATAGALGSYLDLTITAPDGTLPTAAGACETADVQAVVTVSPGETLSVRTTGEVCTHEFSPSTLMLNAYFDSGDLQYAGTAHKKAKAVGDGMISASNGTMLGWGLAFSSQVRWIR